MGNSALVFTRQKENIEIFRDFMWQQHRKYRAKGIELLTPKMENVSRIVGFALSGGIGVNLPH
jgi:hypothetical protein